MLWPGDYDVWHGGQHFKFHGGIYKPAGCVPKPGVFGSNATFSAWTAADISVVIEKFQTAYDAKQIQWKPLASVKFSAKLDAADIATLKAMAANYAPLVSPAKLLGYPVTFSELWDDGYDVRKLPANPRVTLHPHPNAIDPERARQITGGSAE